MSYDKSKSPKDYKKVFISSQRKDSEMKHVDRSSLSLNNRLVWIPGKSNTSMHNNIYSNNREINSSSTSNQCREITDNHNSNTNLLETNNTYTIVNITSNGSSQEKVSINALAADTRQDIVLDQPQKKMATKKNDCYTKKSTHNYTDDGSLATKNGPDVIYSVTDQHTKSLDDCSLTDCTDVIQKENDDEFDIFFVNNQRQLEIKTINI
ncbi:PREDICTED: uncharacterized protein LOC107170011 [Diuraphis noxia]|uniref:uncharacterized protein LOC107170011 n=1 Tax=Diuraphis noxia TaxID=143948 RepID=UPI000763774C|nr:PREDICTED: uncharacterized protein LOC107170011 [Diuraphis noxia]